jgi:hypothetical protein
MAVSGISTVLGPTDGYLALAEATCGDLTAASQAAERALEQAAEHGLPVYVAWLEGNRTRLGF